MAASSAAAASDDLNRIRTIGSRGYRMFPRSFSTSEEHQRGVIFQRPKVDSMGTAKIKKPVRLC